MVDPGSAAPPTRFVIWNLNCISYYYQVFDIGKGEHCPITGIQLLKVPHTMRHVVFVTTLTRFYKFHEVIRAEEKSPYLHVS